MFKKAFSNISKSFKSDWRKASLLALIYLFELFVFVSIPTMSGLDKWHYIPIFLCAIECGLIGLWLIFYSEFFFDKKILFIISFVIYVLIHSIFTGFRAITLTYLLLSGMAIFFYEFIVTSKEPDRFTFIWYLSLVLFAAVFIFVYRNELLALNFDRLGSAFDNVNGISVFFSMGMLLSFYYFQNNKKKNWPFLLIVCIFAVLGATTGSKQFMLSGLVVAISGIFISFGKNKWYLSVFTTGLLVGGVVLISQLPAFSTIKTRLLDFLNFLGFVDTGNKDYSSSERLALFLESIQMFLNKPLFGYGSDGFLRFSYFETYSHNTIGDLLADFGLVGTFLFIYPFVLSVMSIFSNEWKNLKDKTLLSLMSILFACLVISNVLMGNKIYYIGLSIIMSLSTNRNEIKDFALFSFKRTHGLRFALNRYSATPKKNENSNSRIDRMDI